MGTCAADSGDEDEIGAEDEEAEEEFEHAESEEEESNAEGDVFDFFDLRVSVDVRVSEDVWGDFRLQGKEGRGKGGRRSRPGRVSGDGDESDCEAAKGMEDNAEGADKGGSMER